MSNKKQPKVYRKKLADLKPLENNPNVGTERGQYMLEESFDKGGAGRSILIADNDEILAGNHASGVYGERMDNEDVIIVETDGDTLVAVKRRDIPDADDPRAKHLIIADNRSSEVGLKWDIEALQHITEDTDIDLNQWFFDDELEELLNAIPDVDFPEYDESVADEVQYCECPECGHKFPK